METNIELEIPQFPECGYWNMKIVKKEHVDFYGCTTVYQCDCEYKKEIA